MGKVIKLQDLAKAKQKELNLTPDQVVAISPSPNVDNVPEGSCIMGVFVSAKIKMIEKSDEPGKFYQAADCLFKVSLPVTDASGNPTTLETFKTALADINDSLEEGKPYQLIKTLTKSTKNQRTYHGYNKLMNK